MISTRGSVVVELLLMNLIVAISAAPPIHQSQRVTATLNHQANDGKGGAAVLTVNKAPEAPVSFVQDAERQLEDLKQDFSGAATTLKPKLGILNLETPAVSDNSHPPPELPFGNSVLVSKLIEKKTDPRPGPQGMGKFSNNLNTQTDYTPQDIAEYIFWTGDERSVINALNDFMQQDLVNSDDVLQFLESIRIELKNLATRFDSVVTHSRNSAKEPPQSEFGKLAGEALRDKRVLDETPATKEEDADYDELVHKMNEMNVKLREDSLREIIYRLAKEVFSDNFGEYAIQRFIKFVKDATSSGHIPRDLEKSILDTMVSALVDALFERDLNQRKNHGRIEMGPAAMNQIR